MPQPSTDGSKLCFRCEHPRREHNPPKTWLYQKSGFSDPNATARMVTTHPDAMQSCTFPLCTCVRFLTTQQELEAESLRKYGVTR